MQKIINVLKKIKYKSLDFKQSTSRSLSYLFKFSKYFLKNLRNEYKFPLSDRYIGTKLLLDGYKQKTQETYKTFNEKFDKITVKNIELYAPKKAFKKGELAYLHNEIFTPRKQNPHAYETNFLRIEPGDVVIDAGSCEGFFTFHALDKKAKKVYAFEPLEVLEESLTETFSQEIKTKKVAIVKKGLSNETGKIRFNSGEEYICTAQFDEQGDQVIETTSLDDFVHENKCKKINFIKMDIEGAEIKAIQGAQETIKKFRPKLSIAVYHEYKNAKEIKNLIEQYVPEYKIIFGGCFMHETPYRPYMLYAYHPK